MSNINQTITQRGKQYGSFDDVALMSQQLKGILHNTNTQLSAVQQEAVEMICVKLARICAGVDPSYADNWRDIAGYAVLGGKLEN
ncbi:DUF6378 domain-containing protein [Ursidibacter arcticus]|uniref:DUF6378 domain-containing protein n=1 Tax=Ursidibacter arcticus TaxID=1524965 RepID=UPI001F07C93F|nr:DUF6378 domain-containing protein [Ursidibacter arcticus]